MSNFNLDDIIELAKQGYKPADIKELIELSKSEGTKPEGEQTKDDQKKEQPKKEKPKDDQNEKPKDLKPEDEAVDYKEKVTQLEGELQRSKNMLSNEKFLSKAPAEKIAEEKEKQQKYQQTYDQITERLAQLSK